MKLRSHFVILVLAALLPVVIFSAVMVVLFARQERAVVETGLKETARALSVAVDRELESSITTLEALSASDHLDSGALRRFYEQARRALEAHDPWSTIALFDPTGRQLLNLLRPYGDPLPLASNPGFLREVLGTRRPQVSDLFFAEVSRDRTISIGVPVSRDGEIRYVLAASLNSSALAKISARHKLPEGWAARIFDRNRVNIGRIPAGDQVIGQLGGPEFFAKSGESGEAWFRLLTGERTWIYVATTRSPLSGWTVALTVPASAVDVSVQRSLSVVIGGGILFVLLGIALAALFGRRIAGPITALSGSAKALGQDETLPPIAPSAVDEVNALGSAIEQTGALLRERSRQRKRAEERRDQVEADLRRANEAKDELLAMLGHELRNPISAISHAVTVLERIGGQEEQNVRLRGIIGRQTAHLARLVNDLLEVSRVTFGKIVLRREVVDLAAVAERSVGSLHDVAREKRQDLSVAGEPALVEGDPMRLEQVVWNLVENAVKYTPPGGRIQVSVHKDGDHAVLQVQDNGLGIDPEMLPRIFDLFTQGDRSLDRAEGGLGLGLTLVRRLTEVHGGTVEVLSEGRGRGSTFVARFPLSISAMAAPAAEPAPVLVPSRRILIIEDNRDAREALRVLLELWGHQVEAMADGTPGIGRALAWAPDLALIDIGLPGLDGYEIARQIRAAPAGTRIFLVALTGYGQPDDRRRALAAGFDAHLVKPVDADELSRVLAIAREPRGGVPVTMSGLSDLRSH